MGSAVVAVEPFPLRLGSRLNSAGMGQYSGHGESGESMRRASANAGKTLRQAARALCGRARSRGGILAEEASGRIGAPGNALRRWAPEHEKGGGAAFPGKGGAVASRGYEILGPKKGNGGLRREAGLLEKSGPSRGGAGR